MMKKWTKKSNTEFGDFSSEQHFQLQLKNPSEYFIGRFLGDKKDGLGIQKNKNGSALFAKYEKDITLFPIVVVDKEGNLEIDLGKDSSGSIYHLSFNSSNSSFVYYKLKDGQTSKNSIAFNGETNIVSFYLNKGTPNEKREDIARRFIPERPIVSKNALVYPDINSFNAFDFSGDDDYSMIENSPGVSDPGIGVIEWPENNYCVGGWRDNFRDGWQIYQMDKYYMVYYGHRTGYNGMYVNAYNNGDVYIKVIDGDDNSYMLTFREGLLSFSDIHQEYQIDRSGPGIRFPNLTSVEFVNYINDNDAEASVEEKFSCKLREQSSGTVLSNDLSNAIEADSPEGKIMNLVGQAEAKKEFMRIRAYLMKNDALNVCKHMTFIGPSGCGKSTFAKELTRMLYKYNAIEEENYYEISAKELYSNFTGESSSRIDTAYKRAKGGVLLIDDIHFLDSLNNSGLKEAINTLTKLMSEDTHTVFILSDNKYNIKQLLENNCDTLGELVRFKINFIDFSKAELKDILLVHLKEKGYSIEEDAIGMLLEVIYLSKAYGNDINASAALSILEEVIIAQNVRSTDLNDKLIIKDDVQDYIIAHDIAFLDPKTGGQSDARKKLDELIGLEHIKETIDDLIAYFAINRGKKVDFHMAFSGNPGTGKTEVARIIGKLLRQEGILNTAKFNEVSRRDLVGEYIGQSAIKTRDIIDKSMGGVLYIDEAYSLAYGGERDFGKEVIAELLKAMEDRRGEFCVILSGYTKEMQKLFSTNPGFESRIKFNLEFPDYNDEELEEILKLFLTRDNYELSEENIKLLISLVSRQRDLPNFANVRTLREFLSRLQIKQASRIRKEQTGNINTREITYEDIIAVFGESEVNAAKERQEKNTVEKLSEDSLKDLYKFYPNVPFMEYKDFISEVVIAIRTQGPESGESSGFIINNKGYALTCAHCVDGADYIEVRRRIYHRNKRIDINYEAKVVSIDKKNDVALIKLLASKDDEFDYISLADPDYILPPLSKVYLLGYPFGFSRFDEMSIVEGSVASYQKGKDGQPDQINLDIQANGGNSGSLIVDAKTSKVIGILTGASLSPHGELIEQINFCRPISYAWSLIEKDSK